MCNFRQPVTLPATRHVRTNHPAMALNISRDVVKIMAVSRQAMHTDEYPRIVAVAPLQIMKAMRSGLAVTGNEVRPGGKRWTYFAH